MFYQRNNGPFGRGGMLRSRYQYQTLPYGYEGAQASGLIGKVMGLLAFSFLFAAIGSFVGLTTVNLGFGGGYWIVAIGGLVVLLALNFLIQVSGLNLILLYLFTFLEGLALSPLLRFYTQSYPNILSE